MTTRREVERTPFWRTLRFRFGLWVVGLLFLTMIVYGAFIYISLDQGLASALDDALRVTASQAVAATNYEEGRIELSDNPLNAAAASLRERGLTIRILNLSGAVVQAFGPYQKLPVNDERLAKARQNGGDFSTITDPESRVSVRLYTTPIIQDDRIVGMLQVAQSMNDVQGTLNRLLAALLFGVPTLVAAAGIGGYLLVRQALQPIDKITRTAHRISAEDLSARLNLARTDDEVGRLAATFDGMLSRLDEAFQRERQFTADASHELRTPLTAVQAILNTTRQRRRTPEDYEQALDDIAEEVDRLRTLAENLLQLARGETHKPSMTEEINLSLLLQDVTDALCPLAENKGLRLICEAEDDLVLRGDSDSLIRLFINLLDNAIKYTERGEIVVKTGKNNGVVRVSISDTGCGISPEYLPHIFDRFYRAETSRTTRGTGLGLTMAMEITRLHGGTIEVKSIEGRGSVFTVLLPIQKFDGG